MLTDPSSCTPAILLSVETTLKSFCSTYLFDASNWAS
jgi:hypothetical protein